MLTATGEPIDPYEIFEDDDEDRPADSITRSQVHDDLVVQTRRYCDNLAARGWKGRWSATPPAEPTETEREQMRAERRDVIAANKAWLAAEQVRSDWLKTFCARKTDRRTARPSSPQPSPPARTSSPPHDCAPSASST